MEAEPGEGRLRRQVTVTGVVQGVGFRPHVYALATGLGLTGSVANSPEGVVIEVEGDEVAVGEFCRRVGPEAPPLASVATVSWAQEQARGDREFRIRPSQSAAGPGRTLTPADAGICDDCLHDLTDPGNRRYRHPFVTCTNCGPRFTIIRDLPYDRARTTMARFAMCRDCAREYADPADRRFHAETICCPGCGPRLSLVTLGGQAEAGESALATARRLLAAGAVVAVKGLGGYHLACDATSEAAVALLRKRKRRGDQPFAVMVADLAMASRLADLGAEERVALQSRQRPIVLASRRDGDCAPSGRLADSVAPGLGDVGLMLPYTPLHHLLLGLRGDPSGPAALVMTSGNRSGEPLVIDDDEALERLADLADAWLAHDRPIHVPCDDSVMRIVDRAALPVRRSRGHAPLPVDLPFMVPPTLAVGGDLKNTFCLAASGRAWLSPHVGDMGDFRTQQAFGAATAHLEALTGIQPEMIAADRHPDYRSSRWAAARASGRPLRQVQHHHAHVASTLAEHGHDGSRHVLGVAFDGTGYGDDGAVWGSEFLLADYAGYTRAAHLRYVPLPGGDAGVRNPWRMALSHLRAAGVDWDADLPCVQACSRDDVRMLGSQLDGGIQCVPTSSMGRLFDAIASIAGVCQRSGYEAQAAAELEALARRASGHDGRYGFAIGASSEGAGSSDGSGSAGDGPPLLVDAAPVVAAAAVDALAGISPSVIAVRFHRAVTDAVTAIAERVRADTGISEVTLSGGVFVNVLLSHWCAAALTDRGFTVLRHRRVPPTDAGLALGQVAVAAKQHAAAKQLKEE
ncbi:MAG TPA: carbamoyltransferase HypF [Trebonia sp.]|nr:carbamoyltransferase HypF [Trebonia sp.]